MPVPITPTYPGVYVEEVPSGVRTIAGVSTSVAAFVGYTLRGPNHEPVQVFSFADYERAFGGFSKDSPVSYAVHHFFLNGGSEAWVIRVADGAVAASVTLRSSADDPGDVLVVTARSEGAWGNNLRVEVDYDTANPHGLFNLTATELVNQGGARVPGRVETHRNLSMNAFSPQWVEGVVNAASELITVSRTAAAAAAAQGNSATSTSGLLGAGFLGQLDDDHRALALSVNGGPAVEFEWPSGLVFANPGELETALNGALGTAFPGLPLTAAFINSDTQIEVTLADAPNGERSELRFRNASARNAAGVLKLGLANGGSEADGSAPIRPVESGTRAEGVADLATLPGSLDIDVLVDSATLPAGAQPTSLEGVRQALQSALQASERAALGQARVFLDPRGLRVVAGGPDPNVRLTFTNAEDLLLSGAPVENVAVYSLGAGGATFRAQSSGAAGNDGAAPATASVIGQRSQKTGLYALEDVDLFNILCLPDQSDLGLLSQAIAYASERRAFVVLDFPAGVDSLAEAKQWLGAHATLRHKNAALYFPRIHVPDPLDNGRARAFPAAGAIAGLYARTDASRGVWKAPAGTEARLSGVLKVDVPLSDPENGVLNPLGINCVRMFPVYGPVIWGSRTLEGADALASEWKYVPVRRLALFVEESLYRGTKWVVFEPNDEPLWAQIRLNVGAFMHNLFRQGAFQGQTPRDAYFVRCDKDTTTQNDVNLGVVNVLVGFAPLKPAEFVVVKIQQIAGQIPT
jgi:phage tail sheath protein FI